jgi:cell division protein FtsL
MKNEINTNLSPNKIGANFFISLVIFLVSMMSVLFARMELKRKSYEIYKLSSEFKIHDDEYRNLYTDYSKKVSDRTITGLALNSITVKSPSMGKIINVGSTSFMVKQ